MRGPGRPHWTLGRASPTIALLFELLPQTNTICLSPTIVMSTAIRAVFLYYNML